jgi:ACS family hexuronate transporter-like MFS transporter
LKLTEKQLRWAAVWVLVLSSALNYLDRAVLNALMPELQRVFNASREQMGLVLSAFSLVYAFSSPLMGLMIDRLGLRAGTAIAVLLWSGVGAATGLVGSMGGLLFCRGLLGFAEAGGIPATGKGFALFLPPESRALGGALSGFGLAVGSVSAPLLVEGLFPLYGWRAAFVVSGALGLLWLPFWLWISARAPAIEQPTTQASVSAGAIVRDRKLITLVIANVFAMTVYSLWTNWATLFLVTAYGVSREEANLLFAWIPPVFATAGGLLGGWLAQRMIRAGAGVIQTRLRISTIAAICALTTALASAAPGPALATAAICVSIASILCLSVNYYALPLDLFGAARAAFAVSMLTGVYGLMQTLISPLIGRWSEQFGWQPVCSGLAALPLLSVLLLRTAFRKP